MLHYYTPYWADPQNDVDLPEMRFVFAVWEYGSKNITPEDTYGVVSFTVQADPENPDEFPSFGDCMAEHEPTLESSSPSSSDTNPTLTIEQVKALYEQDAWDAELEIAEEL